MRHTAIAIVTVLGCGSPSSESPDAPASGSGDAPATTEGPLLPAPTGACPELVAGDVTFAPAGMSARKVKLAFDPAAASDHGPLVLYWHATGSSPMEAAYALGATAQTIHASGGIIATPYSDPAAGQFEWFIVNQSPTLDDFTLADEIVGCLHQAHRIDPTRIHSMGMSAGGLQTTAFSFLRSAYVASVATYSGGLPGGFTPAAQDPANRFAALIFAGGASDNVFGVDFTAASERFRDMLTASGHFAAICDHGNGHKIPLDAAPSVATFFAANPYGAWPSPYASGLPATFPSYCAR